MNKVWHPKRLAARWMFYGVLIAINVVLHMKFFPDEGIWMKFLITIVWMTPVSILYHAGFYKTWERFWGLTPDD